VFFTGFVAAEDRPRYFATCDVFCAPSTGQESFGIVLLEAMASGLPVVATEVEGYMSVLEPGRDSMTVQPKGWAELSAALIILARDADLRRRMGDYGHEKAKRYGWEAVASQIVEVYDEARAAAAGRVEEMNVHDAV